MRSLSALIAREFTSNPGMSLAMLVTLTNLRMTRWRSSLVAASLLLLVGCATKRMSPANVAKLLTHIDSVNSFNGAMSHYECTGPQRDWDYICDVRYDPQPGSSRKPTIQRVGLTLAMKSCEGPECRPEYRGKPVFNRSVLPEDGPVPSRAELSEWIKAQAENASQPRRAVTVASPPEQPVLLQATPNRPTIIFQPSAPPRRNFSIVYYDDKFLFAARHYGSAGDPGGNTAAGLFVHSKEKSRWIVVNAISTAGGRFGTSVSNDPQARKRLSIASVGWDFTHYAQRPYIEQPLRTSGSIAFPEVIEYNASTDRYTLRYLTSWRVPSAETVLYIRRPDLVGAFAKP